MRPESAKTVGLVLRKFARDVKLIDPKELDSRLVEGWLDRPQGRKESGDFAELH